MKLENLIGLVLIIDLYVLIYYRLMVRFFYEKEQQRKESAFGALFSLPPYKVLSEKGRRYAKRYWFALAVLIFCFIALAVLVEMPFRG